MTDHVLPPGAEVRNTRCYRCNGPKGPGRGVKLCPACREARYRKPCTVCGGAKTPGAENTRRGRIANKTHCKHGHEFTPENTYVGRDGKGRVCRNCRTCGRNKDRRRYWEKKAS